MGLRWGTDAVCRWNAYIGQPLLIGELLYRTKHTG